MSIQSQSDELTGMLRIIDGVNSDRKAQAIKAGLGDLPGVHGVECNQVSPSMLRTDYHGNPFAAIGRLVRKAYLTMNRCLY